MTKVRDNFALRIGSMIGMQLSRDIDAIKRSQLFDYDFYRKQCPSLSSRADLVRHFVKIGSKEDLMPNPYFRVSDYLFANPDLSETQMNLFAHYVVHGRLEGRLPMLNSVALSKSEIFDAAFYTDCYPDVKLQGFDPFRHFLHFGIGEQRLPNANFNWNDFEDFRAATNLECIEAMLSYIDRKKNLDIRSTTNEKPDLTYDEAQEDRVETLDPRGEKTRSIIDEVRIPYEFDPDQLTQLLGSTPIFDPEWYANQAELSIDEAKRHYVAVGVFLDLPPGPFFCPMMYREFVQGSHDLLPPIMHYLSNAKFLDQSPHKFFDSKFYQLNAQLNGLSALDAYTHFIRIGSKQGILPSPLFDYTFYKRQYDDERRLDSVYSDFILTKYREGRTAARFAGRVRNRPSDIYFSIVIDATSSSSTECIVRTLRSLQEAGPTHYHTLILVNSIEVDCPKRASAIETIANKKIDLIDVQGASLSDLAAKIEGHSHGSHVLLLNSGVVFRRGALQQLVNQIAGEQGDIYYCDSVTITSQSRVELDRARPDWSPILFASSDYLGPVLGASRRLFRDYTSKTGVKEDPTTDLRRGLVEQAISVVHVPISLATEEEEDEKRRRGAVAQNRIGGALPHIVNKNSPRIPSKLGSDGAASVSIVLCSYNNPERLRQTISMLVPDDLRSSVQIIVVDGFSEPFSQRGYQDLAAEQNITVVSMNECNFSTARAYNIGAAHATSDYILFAHDDVFPVDPNTCLFDILDYAGLSNVGIIGPLLVYQDNSVQSAGFTLGAGVDNRLYENSSSSSGLSFVSPYATREIFAVSAAFIMVKANLFKKAGGFCEHVSEDWSSLLLSQTIRGLGAQTVLASDVIVVHEARGRASDITSEIDDDIALRTLASMNVTRDPFWNDRLASRNRSNPLKASPSKQEGALTFASRMKTAAERSPNPWFFAFWNDHLLAERCSLDIRDVIWAEPSPAEIRDVYSAARWIISTLRRRPDLRQAFGCALSDGEKSLFFEELETNSGHWGLDQISLAHLRSAFRAGLGMRPRDYYVSNPQLMEDIPFGLVNDGLLRYLTWLLQNGSQHEFLGEEIWWFVIEALERPDLVMTIYLGFNPQLQREQPALMSGFQLSPIVSSKLLCINSKGQFTQVHGDLQRLAYRCRLAFYQSRFLQSKHPQGLNDINAATNLLATIKEKFLTTGATSVDPLMTVESPLELAKQVCQPSVNVFSHFFYPSGLKISADSISRGLSAAEVEVYRRDAPANSKTDLPGRSNLSDLEVGDITIIHVQPEPFFDDVYSRVGLHQRTPRPYRIAYWYWELEDIPQSWVPRSLHVDEIWAATKFNYEAFKRSFSKPVFHLSPGIELTPFQELSRAEFGLAEDSYVFLFSFHMYSIMERKNPLGLIRAFRQAFGSSKKAQLVIKTTFGERYPENMGQLLSAAAGANVKIINEIFTESQNYALLNVCDCYVSLHRSEGYGLTMAEAMLLKKPVIATGYSGNLDFMTTETGVLVDYELRALASDCPPYWAGAKWAEPSIDHAAECMRMLERNRRRGRQLGEAAFKQMQTMNYLSAGRRMADRVKQILEGRGKSGEQDNA